ncbi:MAG: peptide deformylase [Acidobacteriota bacterium]
MILPIVKYGEEVLQRLCEPVEVFDEDLKRLAQDMVETMYAAPGYGLAAPQVGVARRLIVLDVTVGQKPDSLLILANPELVFAEGDQYEEEGCLSIPNFTARVHRPLRVTVSGQDLSGRSHIVQGESILARVLSHEIDHLNGILFIDHLGAIKRDMIKRKIRKLVRAGEW